MAEGDLTSLEAVKEWLSITNDVSDVLLGRILSATSKFVSGLCNSPITPTDFEEVYDGSGKDWMLLRFRPVIEVTGLWINGHGAVQPAQGDGKSTRWTNGYTLPPFDGVEQKIVLYDMIFPRVRSCITVNYRAGYETVPMDVQEAVWELVGARYRYMDRIGYTSKSLGGQETVSYAPNRLDDYSKSLLRNYLRVAPV